MIYIRGLTQLSEPVQNKIGCGDLEEVRIIDKGILLMAKILAIEIIKSERSFEVQPLEMRKAS